ncbi:hypothetical protein B0T19DRAFT_445111 [Cercophora scortea]|uniref:F-box domain-containing protein n=1 Tax=Cercophora scortea TaxID=314031 RepID=A0AAE0IA84_9PEZI|nr:hypothetical protein B0T19DRAFT_445111 [Cercophora scortea]
MGNDDTALTLEGMPTEVLEKIILCLNLREMRKARLISTRFDDICTRFVFSALVCYPHIGDFDMLRHFASRPRIARAVKTILYSPFSLDLNFQKYDQFKREGHFEFPVGGGIIEAGPTFSTHISIIGIGAKSTIRWTDTREF